MNISYNWLKDLIDLDLTAEETAAALTRVGLAVEGTNAVGNDHIFDIDLTSNRSDCLSHLGIARELQVITGNDLAAKTELSADEIDGPDNVPFPALLAPDVVKIESPDLCYRFTARIIRGVKIGPSPSWLAQRLEALGERSINNVADTTNYVMLELGQPMHAFDLNKLAENRIVVRKAKIGESITTLDEVERKLDESMLMICDAERPVAVGGIMGGLHSGITDSTTDVLLEVAYFDRENIRRSSRKLGLATEASYRFERGVDIDNLRRASDRAAELIVELAGGTLDEFIDVYPNRQPLKVIEATDISMAVERLTGLNVPTEKCLAILDALGIKSSEDGNGLRSFTVPAWRHDLAIEEDLVEEVARHTGYENIGAQLPPAFGAGEYQPTEFGKRSIRRALIGHGFDEALSYSFIDVKHDEKIKELPALGREDSGYVSLKDSVIEGAVRMRATLLPGLLDAVRLNLNHQRRDLKLFEIGKVFAATSNPDLPKERESFALIITGRETSEGRASENRPIDFFDLKGAVESSFAAAGLPSLVFKAADAIHLQKGQAAEMTVHGSAVGYIGRLNEELSRNYKFKQPVYVAEIDLQKVFEEKPDTVRYEPLPKYPSVIRDVSFLTDRSTPLAAVMDLTGPGSTPLLKRVSFIDNFEDDKLEGVRSLTVRFEYRSDDRTLTEEEVTASHDSLMEKLRSALQISLRI